MMVYRQDTVRVLLGLQELVERRIRRMPVGIYVSRAHERSLLNVSPAVAQPPLASDLVCVRRSETRGDKVPLIAAQAASN